MFHADKAKREIYIDDEIGKESTGRIGNETIVKGLSELGKGPVTIRLSTPGGDLLEGFKMIENLRRHKGQITVSCDSLVASAGTLFLIEPSWIREASATCEIMVHRVSSGMIGNANELRDLANVLEKYDQRLASLYSAVTNLSIEQALEKMTAETYFSAAEAVAIGFLDRIVGSSVDAKQYPRLAKATANAKRYAMARQAQPAVAASASSTASSWSKVDRMQRAMKIARKSAERKAYERKIAIAMEAIRSNRDVQEALRNAK
jgi:ATP-dependent protease ClpP protease subunit